MSYNQLDEAGDKWGQFTWIFKVIGEIYSQSTREHIKCTQCDRHFEAYGYEVAGKAVLQANDCNAWSVEKEGKWVIHCGYGSSYDMHEYFYLRDFPTNSEDPICDYCIERMKHSGQIAFCKEQVFDYSNFIVDYLERGM